MRIQTLFISIFVLSANCKINWLLTLSSGLVLAFGSNSYGQLGMGDLVPRGAPVPLHGLGKLSWGRIFLKLVLGLLRTHRHWTGYCVHLVRLLCTYSLHA